MHFTYMKNGIHAYFVASSLILRCNPPTPLRTTKKKIYFKHLQTACEFYPIVQNSLPHTQPIFFPPFLFFCHSFTIILVVSLMYPPSSSSSTPKACCHLVLMCFPCSAGSRNMCTHRDEQGCWSPQGKWITGLQPRFFPWLLCTPVKAVGEYFSHFLCLRWMNNEEVVSISSYISYIKLVNKFG